MTAMDNREYSQLVKQAHEAYARYDAAEKQAKKSAEAAQKQLELVASQIENATKNWVKGNSALPMYMTFVVAPKMGAKNVVSFGGAKGYIKSTLKHLPVEVKRELNCGNREATLWLTDDHVRMVIKIAREFLPARNKSHKWELISEFPLWALMK